LGKAGSSVAAGSSSGRKAACASRISKAPYWSAITPPGTLGDQARPRWNFHKYLVGSDGKLTGWFPTATEPTSPEVVRAIEAELAKTPQAGG